MLLSAPINIVAVQLVHSGPIGVSLSWPLGLETALVVFGSTLLVDAKMLHLHLVHLLSRPGPSHFFETLAHFSNGNWHGYFCCCCCLDFAFIFATED